MARRVVRSELGEDLRPLVLRTPRAHKSPSAVAPSGRAEAMIPLDDCRDVDSLVVAVGLPAVLFKRMRCLLLTMPLCSASSSS